MSKEKQIKSPGPGWWLVFECGYECPDIMRFIQYHITMCPTCGARLCGKIYTCEACKKTFLGSEKLRTKKYCLKCSRANYKKKWDIKKNDQPVQQIDSTCRKRKAKPDCFYYESVCLPAAIRNRKSYVPCDNCADYTPFPLRAEVS